MDQYNIVVGWSGWPILLHLLALGIAGYAIYYLITYPASRTLEIVFLALIAVLLAVIIHRREDAVQQDVKKEACCGRRF